MSHRLSAALAAGALALATVAATAAPAQAGRRTLVDDKRDVIKRVGAGEAKLAPSNQSADVRRFVTTLTQQKLVLSTTVRALPRNYWAMLWQVQTDTGATYTIDLLKTGGVTFALSTGGVDVPCEAMTKSVNPVKGKVTAVVPLTCLGMPGAVRAGAGAAATDRDFGRIFTDDAARTGKIRPDRLRLGRTVKRG
ncbi:MAG: hypothetical protein LH468_08365 [Nocardioides sp.]|nr:hypothetical protein [Nocardioides sp.]